MCVHVSLCVCLYVCVWMRVCVSACVRVCVYVLEGRVYSSTASVVLPGGRVSVSLRLKWRGLLPLRCIGTQASSHSLMELNRRSNAPIVQPDQQAQHAVQNMIFLLII